MRGALAKARRRGAGRMTPPLFLGLVESGTEIKRISLTLGPVIRKLFTDLEDRDSVSGEGVMAEGSGECQASLGSPLTPRSLPGSWLQAPLVSLPASPHRSLQARMVPSPSPPPLSSDQAATPSLLPSFAFFPTAALHTNPSLFFRVFPVPSALLFALPSCCSS